MGEFLEILKYILPALVVFLTVYFVIGRYLRSQYQLQYLKTQQSNASHNIPIKLQAYERLVLFLERIKPTNLVYRLRNADMTVSDLSNSLLISVQKEFEHNQAQQLYVSNDLWKIICLAKDQSLQQISEAAAKFNSLDNAETYANALLFLEAKEEKSAIGIALNALKEEAKLILNTP